MSFGWDAFGRLAFGQVEQNYASTFVQLGGVTASGSAGIVGAGPSGVLTGVARTSGVGGFAGTTTTMNGTPIGALLTLTIGTTVTAGNGDKIVAKTLPGIANTGSPGTAVGGVSANLGGVTANSGIGFFSFTPAAVLPGRAATGAIGAIAPTVSGFTLVGVGATAAVGVVLGEPGFQALLGVAGNGAAGQITIQVSGGGGKAKKITTGLEPVKKPRLQPPAPVRLPTYAIPNFRPRPQAPPAPRTPTPFDRPKGVAPLNFTAMRDDIRAAQDQADIKAVLEFLDAFD